MLDQREKYSTTSWSSIWIGISSRIGKRTRVPLKLSLSLLIYGKAKLSRSRKLLLKSSLLREFSHVDLAWKIMNVIMNWPIGINFFQKSVWRQSGFVKTIRRKRWLLTQVSSLLKCRFSAVNGCACRIVMPCLVFCSMCIFLQFFIIACMEIMN